MDMTALVGVETIGRVLVATLSRPPVNAINDALVAALDAVLEHAIADPAVAVLHLRSDQRAFSAGADLALIEACFATPQGPDAMTDVVRKMQRLYWRLESAPLVTLAEIDTLALGGGLELALACDLRLATPDALFAMPEVQVGAIPGWGGTRRLARLIGASRTKQMIFRALRVDAATALAWGLVDEVVAAPELARRAEAIAGEIAAGAPGAIRIAKQLVDGGAGGLDPETLAAGLAASLEDAREGIAAFKAKRPPRFTGR